MIGVKRVRKTLQRGDTIVEVLISIAVIATVLGGAFVVVRTSNRNVRISQEHVEALGLLRGQVELLRSIATASGGFAKLSTAPATASFCINTSGTLVPSNPANCTMNTWYLLSISRDPGPIDLAATTKYTFAVSWDSLNGGKDQEQLVYGVAIAN